MWEVKVSDEYERRLKRYQKDRPRETKFVLGNLQAFLAALNAGSRSRDIRVGFIHPEPGGVLAVTERGAGGNAVPLRLYVYPDDDSETLFLITMGDKRTQQGDVLFCKRSLKAIRPEGQTPDVQEQDLP
jgi:hypothetical protein